jgi:hypothetical protein
MQRRIIKIGLRGLAGVAVAGILLLNVFMSVNGQFGFSTNKAYAIPPVCTAEVLGCWVSTNVAGTKTVCDDTANSSYGCTCGASTICVANSND